MTLITELLSTLPDGSVREVTVGLHWTAVVVEPEGGALSCGLASTVQDPGMHGKFDVPQAGSLTDLSARELADFATAGSAAQRSIGFAAINALLPHYADQWVELDAADVLIEHGAGKTVAVIGHFPFTDRVREQVGTLHVLELNPGPGDLPASAAPEILPQADVIAITSMTMLNGSFEGLVKLCNPNALTLTLGPTTPLSPVLFNYGLDLLSGSIVDEIDPVLRHVRQGGNFRQVKRAGVRLVTMRPAE
jgi:uncharacterized protein (DUF4213/DUF364 family)